MKNLIKLTIGLLLLSNMFISCEDENDNDSPDNSESPDNYIKFEGEKYEISKGYVWYYGTRSNGDIHRYNPAFYSPEITVHGLIDSLSGTGHAIGFDLQTNKEQLETGEYTFKADLTEDDPYIFNGNAIINTDIANVEEDKTISFTNGNLTIQKDDNLYVFEFKGTTDNGNSISFYYKNNVTFYEDEGVK